MMNDVVVNKIETILRCIKRIELVYQEAGEHFEHDYTRQDSVILNLQRACEASIDLANYINKLKQLGIPQSSRDSFNLLAKSNIISIELSQRLMSMVGLRNIAVHDYQELNLDIVKHVIEHRLVDFTEFSAAVKKLNL